jgi:hypothetical protein
MSWYFCESLGKNLGVADAHRAPYSSAQLNIFQVVMSLIGLIKASKHSGTDKLARLVDGKRIALVGNAQSLFGKNLGPEIDAHDVVIRLNRGFVIDPIQQGCRTDIIGTARPLSLEQISTYSPQLIYWLFWRRWRIPTWNKAIWDKTEIVPLNCWVEANRQMRGRPTSGFVMTYALLTHTKPLEISVFGFDFYKTENFYRGNKTSKTHIHSEEERAFQKMLSGKSHISLR